MNIENRTMTEIMADYILQLKAEDVRPEIRNLAKNFFADAYCVMIAGSHEKPTAIALEYAKTINGDKTASVIGYGEEKLDSYHAALVNGVASHFHDYDDVCTTMIGHPSVAVLPCVLALSEELNVSGEEALRAYIIGMEICALMGRAFSPEHNRIGWHSTTSLGVFGATAAAGCLLNLDADQLANALGIAASESCGLKGNSGTMTKPLHAGRASAKGIMAAKLAKLGYTSNRNIMEMESGWIRVTTRTFHEDAFLKAIEERNSEFLNVGFLMKPWPACRATHNGIWATLELLKEHPVNTDDIEKVDCRVLPYAKDILRYSVAGTPTEGKFSMNYVIAKIILNKRLVMSDFEGTTVDDQKVIDLMNKITMTVDESICPGEYYHYLESTIVDIYMKDGTVISKRCDYAKGTADNPMTREEMHEKWSDCLSRAIKPERIEAVMDMADGIDQLPKLTDLIRFTAQSCR